MNHQYSRVSLRHELNTSPGARKSLESVPSRARLSEAVNCAEFVGPGSYNTIEEDNVRKKYVMKHHKLLGQSANQK